MRLVLLLTLTVLLTLSMAACASRRAQPISSGCTSRGRIALTFDDGPNPPWTGRVLDILAQKQARATFFVEGAAATASPGDVGRAIEMGMAIGNHSQVHRDDYAGFSGDAIRTDTAQAEDAIEQAAGLRTALYRAPYGRWSQPMLHALEDQGYSPIGWDVDSRDWDAATTPDEIAANVLDQAHPGAIVLLHDGGLGGGDPDRSRTLSALPRIIDGLQANGYALVTVPEITGKPATLGGEVASC